MEVGNSPMSFNSSSFSRFFSLNSDPSDPSAEKRCSRAKKWKLHFNGVLRVRRTGEREAFVLTLICALDMYTTLWWVMTGRATEANSNLAWTFEHHPVLFVLVKCISYLPALLLAPRLARRHPVFTVWLLRAIIVFYVGYYLLNVR